MGYGVMYEEKMYTEPSKNCWRKVSTFLSLEHDQPQCFEQSRWQFMNKRGYLIFRLVSCLFFCIFLLTYFFLPPSIMRYGLDWEDKGYFFIYLTSWANILLFIDTAIQLHIVIKAKTRVHSGRLCLLYQFSWVIETINVDLGLTITFFYWKILHDFDKGPLSYATVMAHFMNAVYIILNMNVSARPVRLKHIIFPMFTGLLFVLFSFVYYHLGGTNPHDGGSYIYVILNWKYPHACMDWIGLVAFLIFSNHVIYFLFSETGVSLVSRWRRRICACIAKGATKSDQDGQRNAGPEEEVLPLHDTQKEPNTPGCVEMCLMSSDRRNTDGEPVEEAYTKAYVNIYPDIKNDTDSSHSMMQERKPEV